MKKDTVIYTIFFTFIITFLFTGILALANELTKDRIARNNELFFKKALLNANQIKYDSNLMVEELYETKFKKEIMNNQKIYIYEADKEKYYSIIFHGNGLWGPISGVLTVNESMKEIIGIYFIEQTETPGLGGRIEEESFLEQFKNKKIMNNEVVFVSGLVHKTKSDNKIDSISGATLTSNAIEKIINSYLKLMKN